MNLRFSGRELRDLAIAWLALGLAFTLLQHRDLLFDATNPQALAAFAEGMALSLLTVGVGFLLHELAHKVVAVRFGQIAEFRADYSMLFLAVMGGLVGFLFAAPGAVHHRGRITMRENGLIALAGPVTNVVLAVVFAVPWLLFGGYLGRIGSLGVFINVFLAGFNMIPWGPLDGKKVLRWSKPVFAVTFVPTAGLAALLMFGLPLLL
ncbi:site-2 protease family protein [Haloarculaceae archaeon H-GB2-1]|nr:site-2 protease family protein [Haloarculaceae archaeon H-GB1-1]MEA5409001.1 site-2 protease family protein [Haloarculaceae archaeon H-GB2-1]